MPITWLALEVEVASYVMDIEEVFEAIMADFFNNLSVALNTDFLTFEFSTMASTTKSTSASANDWILEEKLNL